MKSPHRKKIHAAQQAVEKARESVADLHNVDDAALTEIASDMLETLDKINGKLGRLLA